MRVLLVPAIALAVAWSISPDHSVDSNPVEPEAVALSMVLDLSGSMFLEAPRVIEGARTLLASVNVEGRPALTLIERSWRPTEEWRAMNLRVGPLARQFEMRRDFNRPLWSACEWAMEALALRRSRRVLVVVTDGPGDDDRRRPRTPLADLRDGQALREISEKELIDYVERHAVRVYAVGFTGSTFDEAVGRIAVRSGGTVTMLQRDEDLVRAFRRLADAIRGPLANVSQASQPLDHLPIQRLAFPQP